MSAKVVAVVTAGVAVIAGLLVVNHQVARPAVELRATEPAPPATPATSPADDVAPVAAHTSAGTTHATRPSTTPPRTPPTPPTRPSTPPASAPRISPPTPAPALAAAEPAPTAEGSGSGAGPSRMRLRIRAAQDALDKGRYDKALAAAKTLIDERPEAKDAYPIAVKAACALGDVGEAQTYIGQVATKQARRELRTACEAAGTVVP